MGGLSVAQQRIRPEQRSVCAPAAALAACGSLLAGTAVPTEFGCGETVEYPSNADVAPCVNWRPRSGRDLSGTVIWAGIVATGATNPAQMTERRSGTPGDGRDLLLGLENVIGSAFADILVGDSLANRLAGGGGNDVLRGQSGNDRLRGASGNDTISARAGDDTLIGGADADNCHGGNGSDRAATCETLTAVP
jgi:Ca2+-binding RTX toxin-like protein